MPAGRRVRAIEWEVVSRDIAGSIGLSPIEVKKHFGDVPELAIVRCVDRAGEKLAALTEAEFFKALLARRKARDPRGKILMPSEWPVVLQRWQRTS